VKPPSENPNIPTRAAHAKQLVPVDFFTVPTDPASVLVEGSC
jgi:hypothetical protein